jgi:hypothetical protein
MTNNYLSKLITEQSLKTNDKKIELKFCEKKLENNFTRNRNN